MVWIGWCTGQQCAAATAAGQLQSMRVLECCGLVCTCCRAKHGSTCAWVNWVKSARAQHMAMWGVWPPRCLQLSASDKVLPARVMNTVTHAMMQPLLL
jgi:hypothetical protein